MNRRGEIRRRGVLVSSYGHSGLREMAHAHSLRPSRFNVDLSLMTPAPGISSRLGDLFARWRTTLGANAGQFVSDGIIGEDEDAWRTCNPRVLFLSKECNDRAGVMQACGYDLRLLFRESHRFGQNRKTFELNLRRWAYGLQHARRDFLPPMSDAESGGVRSLLRSAVVNLKKVPGAGRCSDRSIREHVRRDREFLIEQIEVLSPTIVVCCGTFRFLPDLFGGGEAGRGNGRCAVSRGILWIDQWHPSAPGKSPQSHYDRLMQAYLGWLGGIAEIDVVADESLFPM